MAALVFAVVSWDRLSALGQGLLLVGLVASAGAGSWAAARRGLQGTAEALGVLAVVLAPLVAQAVSITLELDDIDDVAWGNALVWSWWPFALGAIGAGALAFGRWVGVRGTRHLGAAVVQLAAVLWLAVAPLEPWATTIGFALLAAATAEVAVRLGDAAATVRTWRVGALLWSLVAIVAAATVAFDDPQAAGGRIATAALLGSVALASAAIEARWRPVGWTQSAEAAQVAAAGLVLAAVWRLVLDAVADDWAAVVLGAAAVAMAALAARVDRERLAPTRAVAGVAVLVTSATVLEAVGVAVEAAARVVDGAWALSATADIVPQGTPPVAWGVPSLAVLVAWAVAERETVGEEAVRLAAATAVLAAVLLVPPLAGWPVVVAFVAALVAVAVLAHLLVVVQVRPVPPVALALVVAAGAAATWSTATQGTTLAALVVALALGARTVQLAIRRDDRGLAALAAAVATAAGIGAVVVGLLTAGTAGGAVALVAALGGAAVVAAAARWSPDLGVPRPAALEAAAGAALVVGATAHLIALGVLADVDGVGGVGLLTVALAGGTVASAVAAGRRASVGRSWMEHAAAAAVEALAVTWYRLAEAEVAVPEAYTLPVAALAVVWALVAATSGRPEGERRASWSVEGPALAFALVPTAVVALADPGLTRQLLALVGGAAALVAGVAWHRRAPVDVGTAVLVVVGGQALAPYAAEVPRWLSIGLVGAVLVGVGATFEQRRRDLSEARRRYRSLV